MDSNDGHISIFDWWYHPHSRIGWMTLFSSTIAVAAPRSVCVNSPLRCCCRYRFRSYSGSLLADARMAGPAKSKQKVLSLASGPTSPGSLVPSLLQGHAAKGHPWPIAALVASMPLNPSTIPLGLLTGRLASSARLVLQNLGAKALRSCRNALALLFGFAYTDSSGDSVSESRQEAEWRCCGEGRLAWMPNEERWPGPPR